MEVQAAAATAAATDPYHVQKEILQILRDQAAERRWFQSEVLRLLQKLVDQEGTPQ